MRVTTALDESPNDASETADHDAEVRPWWHSPINLVSLAVAVAVLAGALGWVVGNNQALPDPNATDTGFLQDMRWHHDQAVELALVFLDEPTGDPRLHTLAREILVGQSIETGMMVQLLRGFGAAEINETDIAMSWMGASVALERMPGLASDADIDALDRATGREADRLFVQLMTMHHEGGIHMAEYAAANAATDDVRTMARQIAGSQREEIEEMAELLARLDG